MSVLNFLFKQIYYISYSIKAHWLDFTLIYYISYCIGSIAIDFTLIHAFMCAVNHGGGLCGLSPPMNQQNLWFSGGFTFQVPTDAGKKAPYPDKLLSISPVQV